VSGWVHTWTPLSSTTSSCSVPNSSLCTIINTTCRASPTQTRASRSSATWIRPLLHTASHSLRLAAPSPTQGSTPSTAVWGQWRNYRNFGDSRQISKLSPPSPLNTPSLPFAPSLPGYPSSPVHLSLPLPIPPYPFTSFTSFPFFSLAISNPFFPFPPSLPFSL